MSTLLNDWRDRPTHRRVWALAAPMILSNISVPLVALVDSTVIGHLPHAHQLGAVAVGASLYGFLASMMGFLRMGATGFAAQAAGRNDGAGLRQVLVQGLILAAVFSLLLWALALPFSHLALSLMRPSPALEHSTREFFQVRLLGLPAALASYALIGWFLGTQNARPPLLILLVTNITNIILNLWFVIGLSGGVIGSAWASVVSEWLSVAIGLALTRPSLRAYPGQVAWAALKVWQNWKPMLVVNRDIFLRSLGLQLVFMLITVQGARLGDATVAANALLLNGLMVTAYALDGLAHAVEALCGHAIGAGNRDELRRSMTVACGWSLLASVAFAVLFLFGGHLFIAAQTNIPSVRETADIYLPYLAVLPLIAVGSYLLDGLFIGATRAREMRNAMLLSVALMLPVGWLSMGLGNHGLWLSFLLFMALRAVTLGVVGWRLQQRDGWFT